MLPDLAPYLGRWIAIMHGKIVGVGHDAAEALHMAKRNRPKEMPQTLFVSPQLQVAHALTRYPLVRRTFDLAHRLQVKIYLVGGSVRDMLLGVETHDLDFAVEGDGLALARYVAGELKGAFVPLDARRQTGRVVLGRPPRRQVLDFASLRGTDLIADLRGRDFTINAIAVERTAEGGWQLLDPLNGYGDLMARRLRAASPTSFADDPLRTLRAVRMRVQFGCRLDEQSEKWLRTAVPLLHRVSAERIRDEWFKLLDLPVAADALLEMRRLGLLNAVAFPAAEIETALPPTRPFAIVAAVEQLLDALAGHACKDAVSEALCKPMHEVASQLHRRYADRICDERTYRALLKCGAFLHGVVGRGMSERSQIAADARRRWRLSNSEATLLRVVLTTCPRIAEMARQGTLSPRAIHRYFRQAGEYGVDAAFVALAEALALNGLDTKEWHSTAETTSALWQAFYLYHEQIVSPPPLLSGHDLIAILELEPGPSIGKLLAALREAQAAGKVNTRQEAIAYVQRLDLRTDANFIRANSRD